MSVEFDAMKLANEAFEADPMNLDLLAKLEAAEATYNAARSAAKAKWLNLKCSQEARDSAEDNANDTCHAEKVFDPADQVEWYRIAVLSVEV